MSAGRDKSPGKDKSLSEEMQGLSVSKDTTTKDTTISPFKGKTRMEPRKGLLPPLLGRRDEYKNMTTGATSNKASRVLSRKYEGYTKTSMRGKYPEKGKSKDPLSKDLSRSAKRRAELKRSDISRLRNFKPIIRETGKDKVEAGKNKKGLSSNLNQPKIW